MYPQHFCEFTVFYLSVSKEINYFCSSRCEMRQLLKPYHLLGSSALLISSSTSHMKAGAPQVCVTFHPNRLIPNPVAADHSQRSRPKPCQFLMGRDWVEGDEDSTCVCCLPQRGFGLPSSQAPSLPIYTSDGFTSLPDNGFIKITRLHSPGWN